LIVVGGDFFRRSWIAERQGSAFLALGARPLGSNTCGGTANPRRLPLRVKSGSNAV